MEEQPRKEEGGRARGQSMDETKKQKGGDGKEHTPEMLEAFSLLFRRREKGWCTLRAAELDLGVRKKRDWRGLYSEGPNEERHV